MINPNPNLSHQKEYLKQYILPKDFYYQKDNNAVSKALLGKYLIQLDPFPIGGVIVETESYPGKTDVASHHHHGKITDRTKVIFNKEKGLLYVYKIYGLHHCFGITSGDGEENHNVTLIRAIKPIFGIKELKKRRGTDKLANLLSGPAKIAQALNITKQNYGQCVRTSNIIICDLEDFEDFEIETDTRIGIENYESEHEQKDWRFFVKGCEFLSQ
ncbi:DNA-3-methyladenine glycosylase [candidate division WWE3 bacterium]|nr:DNA-3-methyladenine glycosylase [candidate division WWE3 bacterium]